MKATEFQVNSPISEELLNGNFQQYTTTELGDELEPEHLNCIAILFCYCGDDTERRVLTLQLSHIHNWRLPDIKIRRRWKVA